MSVAVWRFESNLAPMFTHSMGDDSMSKIEMDSRDHVRGHRIIRLNTLRDKIGVSRAKIYEMINPQSPRYDSTFPKPVRLTSSMIGWLESQVDSWIESKLNTNNRTN